MRERDGPPLVLSVADESSNGFFFFFWKKANFIMVNLPLAYGIN
jgi:hypothetical protein